MKLEKSGINEFYSNNSWFIDDLELLTVNNSDLKVTVCYSMLLTYSVTNVKYLLETLKPHYFVSKCQHGSIPEIFYCTRWFL